MKRFLQIGLIAVASLVIMGQQRIQQVPEFDRNGGPTSVVLNDSSQTMTIEFLAFGQSWLPLNLDAGKDENIHSNRVRVATPRDDKATITVELPIEAGKKYRLFWNAKSGMWDFSPVK
jgi:hypothetical protein